MDLITLADTRPQYKRHIHITGTRDFWLFVLTPEILVQHLINKVINVLVGYSVGYFPTDLKDKGICFE